jgi:hypothetical protein
MPVSLAEAGLTDPDRRAVQRVKNAADPRPHAPAPTAWGMPFRLVSHAFIQ